VAASGANKEEDKESNPSSQEEDGIEQKLLLNLILMLKNIYMAGHIQIQKI